MNESVDKEEPEVEGELYEPAPPVPKRNKGPSRCYNVMMIVAYFVLLLMAVVALGSFGVQQNKMKDRTQKFHDSAHSCILYSTFSHKDEETGTVYIHLHSNGVCGYVFWGLISVTIVAFVWFIYSIVQAVIAPRVVSLLRILDLIIMVLTCLLSFTLSVTISAGLDQVCRIHEKYHDVSTCQGAHLGEIPEKNIKKFYYYDVMNTVKSSSWAMTVFLIILSIWYTVTAIAYCCVLRNRRRQYAFLQHQDDQKDRPTAV